jgi:hypothetical protein
MKPALAIHRRQRNRRKLVLWLLLISGIAVIVTAS